MKDLDYYMSLPYEIRINTADDGSYAASIPDLPGCITCADTMEALFEMLNDAKSNWLSAAIEDGVEIKEPTNDAEYSGRFSLRIPKSLHRRLSEKASNEGVSLNQYCSYVLQNSL